MLLATRRYKEQLDAYAARAKRRGISLDLSGIPTSYELPPVHLTLLGTHPALGPASHGATIFNFACAKPAPWNKDLHIFVSVHADMDQHLRFVRLADPSFLAGETSLADFHLCIRRIGFPSKADYFWIKQLSPMFPVFLDGQPLTPDHWTCLLGGQTVSFTRGSDLAAEFVFHEHPARPPCTKQASAARLELPEKKAKKRKPAPAPAPVSAQAPASASLTCPICMERLCEPVTEVCGHSFCRACMDVWLQEGDTCPTCRALILQPAAVSVALRELLEEPPAPKRAKV